MTAQQVVVTIMLVSIFSLTFAYKRDQYSDSANLFGAFVITGFWCWLLWMVGFWSHSL